MSFAVVLMFQHRSQHFGTGIGVDGVWRDWSRAWVELHGVGVDLLLNRYDLQRIDAKAKKLFAEGSSDRF